EPTRFFHRCKTRVGTRWKQWQIETGPFVDVGSRRGKPTYGSKEWRRGGRSILRQVGHRARASTARGVAAAGAAAPRRRGVQLPLVVDARRRLSVPRDRRFGVAAQRLQSAPP